ncbi:HEAT repeat domain-containing protein [Actinomadura sp. LOL_016]|uniref:HEAT repeat domain-containing protein n=1 Tax=Actinomadura sp. LOL_016 TaxID=3345411 RepID=UPI003A8706C4
MTGPDARVTMRKQAARLLERLRPPGAADALLGAWRDHGLHRDVRAAVAAALRRVPDDPRAFAALEEAAGAHASEPLLRTLFQANPDEYAPAVRPRYAALVRLLLAAADGPGVRFRGRRAFQTWAGCYAGGFDDLLATVGGPADPAGDADLRILEPLVAAEVVGTEVLDVLARLLPAARRLAGRGDLVANLLAMRIAGAAGGAAGWPDEWRAVLDGLRRSPHVDVRLKAIDVDPDA